MASKRNRLQVGSAVVILVSNHECRFCITQMYIKHRHRFYGVFCIFHVPDLDQITYGNA